MNIEEIRDRYRNHKQLKMSEIDTQVLHVEPVLYIPGWDIFNAKITRRTSPAAQAFDIEIYENNDNPPRIRIGVECKSLVSPEFNIDKLNNKYGVGRIVQKQQLDGSLYWANKDKDGVGQIRAYCANYPQFSSGESIALLSNGNEWIAFDNDAFLNEDKFHERVTIDCVTIQ